MSEPFIGQIQTFGFNFPPRGWAFCDGQLLPISQNQSLFSLLGTSYGGDGRSNFGLPDLRGRCPIHLGQGPGLSNRNIGSKSGNETTTLTTGNLPPHTHNTQVTANVGTVTSPAGSLPATANDGESNYGPAGVNSTDGMTTTSAGSGQSFNNMPPYLTINFSIALTGLFPSRN